MRRWLLVFLCSGCGAGRAALDPIGDGAVDPPADPPASTVEPTAPGTTPSDPPPDDTRATGFPAVESFEDPGPFDVVVDQDDDCTIHRPAALGTHELVHPVILWGNGTGAVPAIYGGLLDHFATHGFIAAAANTTNAGSGAEMLACLELVTAADADPDSPYFENVDLERVGASGHSQGGAGALMAGLDERVIATAPIQPYIEFILFGGEFDEGSIPAQQAPMFLTSGEDDIIAIPAIHQEPVFDGAPVPIVWATGVGVDHFDALGDGGAFRGPTTAFFRALLMDDAAAADHLSGPCELCADPAFTVEVK